MTNTLDYALTSASFVATSGVTPISLFFETDGASGSWQIDDVSVESVAAPEPAFLFLLGSGALGVFARMRRRQQQ